MPTTDLLALGDEEFVSLTTFRRGGEGVATPVWVARDGDALVVTTVDGSGKVKRLRRDPRVVLRPCDRQGRVSPEAPEAEGRAEVVDDPAAQERPRRALAAKYGLQWRLIGLLGLLGRIRRLRGRPERPRVILRIRGTGGEG